MLARRKQAFRPGTSANHRAQAELFMAFCIYIEVDYYNPTTETICLYIEYLSQHFSSPQSINNYVSGIRMMHKLLGSECPAMDSFEVTLMLRACHLTIQHRPLRRLPMTIELLTEIVHISDSMGIEGKVFKFAMLASFYGFLRQSNLALRSPTSFDPDRNTCRQDVFYAEPGLVILLKWTKTSQHSNSYDLIPLPAIKGSNLCPVQAYTDMTAALPTTTPDQPLLVLPACDTYGYIPVTIRWLSHFLYVLLESLDINPGLYSLHSCRRGGATMAYRLGADYLSIQRHGTWKSSSFWDYITSDSVAKSPVAQVFAKALNN